MLDIAIAIGIALLTVAMAYMGVHVTLHPPKDNKKAGWKVGFVGVALATVALITMQTIRNGRKQSSLHAQLNKIQHNTETPPTFNVPPSQVVITPSPAPAPKPVVKDAPPPPPPAYLATVAEANDMADKIDNLARQYVQTEKELEDHYKDQIHGDVFLQTRLDDARKTMESTYATRYRDSAINIREKLLEEVTDDSAFPGGVSMWNNSIYQNPNTDMTLTAIANNLRILAQKYKEKMETKQKATQ
jgi:hypothetical protein